MISIVGGMSSGLFYVYLGPKYSSILMYMIAIIGNILLILYYNNTDLIPVFIIIINFGLGAAFNIVYLIGVQLIPTLFAARTFGICNIAARTFTVMSPLMAEMNHPIPEYT